MQSSTVGPKSKRSARPQNSAERAACDVTHTAVRDASRAVAGTDPEPANGRRYTPHVARVLAVANQKGGVGKTTTVHSLGAALAEPGERVLLVDLDPQACLTYSVGLDPESLAAVPARRAGRARARRPRRSSTRARSSVLPAAIDLAGSEVHLVGRVGREHAVARALEHGARTSYDVVLVDCPPSLGILTINGLTAADVVLVPLQCETLSHRGVGQLLETVADVAGLHPARPRACSAWSRPCSTAGPATPARCSPTSSTRYGLPVLEPLDPALGPLRRGARPPGGRSSSTRRRRSARSPTASSPPRVHDDLIAGEPVSGTCATPERPASADPRPVGQDGAVLDARAGPARSSSSARAVTAGRGSATSSSRQRHLPFWVWTPWRQLLPLRRSCPACGQRAWLAARWFE